MSKISIPFWTDPPKLKAFEPVRDEGWYHLTPEQQRLSDRLSRIEQAEEENGVNAASALNTSRMVGVLVAVAFPSALLTAIVKVAEWLK